jgi:hypothetical protein
MKNENEQPSTNHCKDMCCASQKCPCWPREGLFDAAEMDVLRVVKRIVRLRYSFQDASTGLEELRHRCRAVQRHRLPYVMSTFVHNDVTFTSTTLLMCCAFNNKNAQWVLEQGVCPNVGQAPMTADHKGWVEGPEHPGRPVHASLMTCTEAREDAVDVEGAADPFHTFGAYPVHRFSTAIIWKRQWHAWHGRASRRRWAACVIAPAVAFQSPCEM